MDPSEIQQRLAAGGQGYPAKGPLFELADGWLDTSLRVGSTSFCYKCWRFLRRNQGLRETAADQAYFEIA